MFSSSSVHFVVFSIVMIVGLSCSNKDEPTLFTTNVSEPSSCLITDTYELTLQYGYSRLVYFENDQALTSIETFHGSVIDLTNFKYDQNGRIIFIKRTGGRGYDPGTVNEAEFIYQNNNMTVNISTFKGYHSEKWRLDDEGYLIETVDETKNEKSEFIWEGGNLIRVVDYKDNEMYHSIDFKYETSSNPFFKFKNSYLFYYLTVGKNLNLYNGPRVPQLGHNFFWLSTQNLPNYFVEDNGQFIYRYEFGENNEVSSATVSKKNDTSYERSLFSEFIEKCSIDDMELPNNTCQISSISPQEGVHWYLSYNEDVLRKIDNKRDAYYILKYDNKNNKLIKYQLFWDNSLARETDISYYENIITINVDWKFTDQNRIDHTIILALDENGFPIKSEKHVENKIKQLNILAWEEGNLVSISKDLNVDGKVDREMKLEYLTAKNPFYKLSNHLLDQYILGIPFGLGNYSYNNLPLSINLPKNGTYHDISNGVTYELSYAYTYDENNNLRSMGIIGGPLPHTVFYDIHFVCN